jgi:hypothetical protein
MPNEETYLNESLRKIAEGAGFVLTGTLIGRDFGYDSRITIARVFGRGQLSSKIQTEKI